MSNDYGTVRVGGERVSLTLRGYVVFLVAGAVVIIGGLWLMVSVIIFAFSPLYG